jgi:hypothetical protein
MPKMPTPHPTLPFHNRGPIRLPEIISKIRKFLRVNFVSHVNLIIHTTKYDTIDKIAEKIYDNNVLPFLNPDNTKITQKELLSRFTGVSTFELRVLIQEGLRETAMIGDGSEF